MIRSLHVMGSLLVCGGLLVGCDTMMSNHSTAPMMMQQNAGKVAIAEVKPAKAATTQPTDNNVNGTVTFTEMGGKVHVTAHIMGLTPNTEHGFHIHASGDISAPDLMSTGGHFNPDNHIHGGPTTSPVHAGDFGNLKADGMGMAMFDLTVDDITIGTGEKNDIVGKAVIIHAKPDDLKTQPTGNSGARVAGGVIELKK